MVSSILAAFIAAMVKTSCSDKPCFGIRHITPHGSVEPCAVEKSNCPAKPGHGLVHKNSGFYRKVDLRAVLKVESVSRNRNSGHEKCGSCGQRSSLHENNAPVASTDVATFGAPESSLIFKGSSRARAPGSNGHGHRSDHFT